MPVSAPGRPGSGRVRLRGGGGRAARGGKEPTRLRTRPGSRLLEPGGGGGRGAVRGGRAGRAGAGPRRRAGRRGGARRLGGGRRSTRLQEGSMAAPAGYEQRGLPASQNNEAEKGFSALPRSKPCCSPTGETEARGSQDLVPGTILSLPQQSRQPGALRGEAGRVVVGLVPWSGPATSPPWHLLLKSLASTSASVSVPRKNTSHAASREAPSTLDLAQRHSSSKLDVT